MKIIRNTVYWLFILSLPLLIISSNIAWGVTSIWIYDYSVHKYPISQTTGIDNDELHKVYQHLIYFYNSKVDSPQVTVIRGGEEVDIFSEKELIHLEDVKDLIQLDYLVQKVALIVMIICAIVLLLLLKEKWRMLIKGFFLGSILTLGIMTVLVLWAVFAFDQLFLVFHLLSFSNDFWILDPTKDFLIMLFPGQFFFDVAIFGFGAVIIESLIIGTAAFITLKLKT
jgi:integral membrane protein (TIGR01906 family)